VQTGVSEFKASLHFQIRHGEPNASRLCALTHINTKNQLISVQQYMMLPTKML